VPPTKDTLAIGAGLEGGVGIPDIILTSRLPCMSTGVS